jgi:carbamoyltransferase
MNLKIKFRESFRPFAPSVIEEEVSNISNSIAKAPICCCGPSQKELCREMSVEEQSYFGLQKLNLVRSTIPAITHVDYSARVQTVSKETNPIYHALISKFHEKYGCAVIINTSFNVRGEPIVCTPQDAYLCFMRTNMDYLIMGTCLLTRKNKNRLTKIRIG